MALSDTGRRILADAAQHPLRLAPPPDKLPAVACRSVLSSLLKQGYVEECTVPMQHIGLGWGRHDGAWTVVRVTNAGMAAIGAVPATTNAPDEAEQAVAADTAQEPGSASLGASAAPEPLVPPTGSEAAQALSTRGSLRNAAHHVLAAWDDEASERAGLADA